MSVLLPVFFATDALLAGVRCSAPHLELCLFPFRLLPFVAQLLDGFALRHLHLTQLLTRRLAQLL
jgi:hypothetical protein